jgi:hypothetical protein
MTITALSAAFSAGAHSTSAATWEPAINVQVVADDWIVCILATDNIGTTDTDHAEHDVDGQGLTFYKLGEYTNGEGAAASGVTVSAWLARNTSGSTIGTFTFSIVFPSAIVEKCMTIYKFRAGPDLAAVVGTLQSSAGDGTAAYGSAVISGLDSGERLYIRAIGQEANSSSQITETAGFTAFSVSRSRNDPLAVLVRGEFLIVTDTGATSTPIKPISGDWASLFVALSEGVTTSSGSRAGRMLLGVG